MASIAISLLVCIVGALAYALASGKASRLGELAFFAGLLATLLMLGAQRVHFP